MKDVGLALRAAYYATLNGNITWESAPVPFVDEKLDVNISEQDVYVIMTSQDEEGESVSNKTKHVNETVLRMQVVNQRRATNTKEVVENVTNQILTLLFPTRTEWNVSLSSPLNLTFAKFSGAQYNPLEKNDQGFMISKVLTFKNRITQQ